jgi:hypothetical protein
MMPPKLIIGPSVPKMFGCLMCFVPVLTCNLSAALIALLGLLFGLHW